MRVAGRVAALVVVLITAAGPASAQTWVGNLVTTNSTYLYCIASSADGSKLVTGSAPTSSSGQIGPIALYVSGDFGATWQAGSSPTATNGTIETVVSSADGTRLGAAGGAALYLSSDSGSNWTQPALPIVTSPPSFTFPTPVIGLASSADGMKLVTLGICGGCDPPAGIYHSSDGGATWTVATTPGATNSWGFVTSSADGVHLAATGVDNATHNGVIYLSGDSGASWQKANSPILGWTGIASSADGSKLVAINDAPGSICTSENFGVTWQLQSGAPPGHWGTVASSADGTRLVAGDLSYTGSLYMSVDSGVTWFSPNSPTRGTNDLGLGWYGVACSADGVKLAAISEWYAVVVGTVSLAAINATLTATPTQVHLHDQIELTLTITNEAPNTVSNVEVSGSIGITGHGGVSLVDILGVEEIDELPPGTNATITYVYEATNYGFVTFSATVECEELGITTNSLPTSARVSIVPKGDLLIKASYESNYDGEGIYQTQPAPPQIVTNEVGTNVLASFDIEIVNDEEEPLVYTLSATEGSSNWITHYLLQGEDVTKDIQTNLDLPTLGPGESLTLVINTYSLILDTNDITVTLGYQDTPGVTLDTVEAVAESSDEDLADILSATDFLSHVGDLITVEVTALNISSQTHYHPVFSSTASIGYDYC
jgi:hypothetical protein